MQRRSYFPNNAQNNAQTVTVTSSSGVQSSRPVTPALEHELDAAPYLSPASEPLDDAQSFDGTLDIVPQGMAGRKGME